MMILNMQTNLYIIQFFSPPNDPFAASPLAAIAEPGNHGFHEFRKICKKDQTPRKVQTPSQKRIWIPRNQKDRVLPPFISWAWHLWYGIFPLASLAVCLAVLPP